MSDPFLGEIRIVPYNFPPRGWALCDGQLLSISQNFALYTIMGTTYGGDGTNVFALPNLQDRFPVHYGAAPGLTPHALGEAGGQGGIVLTTSQTAHSHTQVAVSDPATEVNPSTHAPAQANSTLGNIYHSATNMVAMNSGSIAPTGAFQPHENWSPYLALSFVVALNGIFPSRG